jgi:hypothetical protein
MNQPPALHLNLPTQELDAPTLFAPTAAALTAWLESLPKANLGQSTRSLYTAINELNLVRLTPGRRLELMEQLRPAIEFVAVGLRRHYLGQPLPLPEQARKVALLAQELYVQLAVGYEVSAHALLKGERTDVGNPEQALALALHRATTAHTINLLRSCELYRSPAAGCWHALHQIARTGWRLGLEHHRVDDPQHGDSTLESAYLRALLLGSAKTHQLRQEETGKLFQRLLDWSRMVTLCGPGEGLFAVDPQSDTGPRFRTFCQPAPHWLGFDTRALAEHLAEQLQEQLAHAAASGTALIGGDLSANLQSHLVHGWSTASSRNFLRMERSERIDIALGLTAAHHFLAGGIDFQRLLGSRNSQPLAAGGDNPFLRQNVSTHKDRARQWDVWDSPYRNSGGLTQVSLESIDYDIKRHAEQSSGRERTNERLRSHQVNTVNMSPGGYCLRWPPENPMQLRTGEIVGLRESGAERWSIGVVRWVHMRGEEPHLGVELLSPSAAPYGARVIQTTGGSEEYLRVLLLPEIPQIGQPTTLITPHLPFREGQKVALRARDRETRIQLGRRIAGSAAYNQFEFRRLGDNAPPPKPDGGTPTTRDGKFDQLWDLL